MSARPRPGQRNWKTGSSGDELPPRRRLKQRSFRRSRGLRHRAVLGSGRSRYCRPIVPFQSGQIRLGRGRFIKLVHWAHLCLSRLIGLTAPTAHLGGTVLFLIIRRNQRGFESQDVNPFCLRIPVRRCCKKSQLARCRRCRRGSGASIASGFPAFGKYSLPLRDNGRFRGRFVDAGTAAPQQAGAGQHAVSDPHAERRRHSSSNGKGRPHQNGGEDQVPNHGGLDPPNPAR